MLSRSNAARWRHHLMREVIMKLTGINHLAFITEDMEKTIRLYRDFLGMELTAGIGHVDYRHYFVHPEKCLTY